MKYFTLTIIVLVAFHAGCPSDAVDSEFVQINGRFYHFLGDEIHFVHSACENACRNIGMNLVGLEKTETLDGVIDYVTNAGYNLEVLAEFWTSGAYVGGDWIWKVSGEPIDSSRWASGEPINNDVAHLNVNLRALQTSVVSGGNLKFCMCVE